MQTFKRIFLSSDHVVISENENRLFSDLLSEYSKKFIIQRKTILKFAIILLSIVAIIEFINLITTYTNTDELFLTKWSSNNFMAIEISFLIIDVVKIVLFIFSLHFWSNYKKSIKFVHILGLIVIYLQLSFLFIPYVKLISFINTSHNRLNIWNIGKIVITFVISIVSYFLPITLILQSTISRLSILSLQFKSSTLKIACNILAAVYIPTISFVFFIGYQISVILNNPIGDIIFHHNIIYGIPLPTFIILIYIIYISQIISSIFISKHLLVYIGNIVINCISITMTMLIMHHFEISIWSQIIPMFIRYIIMNIFISDFILGQVIFNKKNDDELNNFISDIHIEQNEYVNMIELV